MCQNRSEDIVGWEQAGILGLISPVAPCPAARKLKCKAGKL